MIKITCIYVCRLVLILFAFTSDAFAFKIGIGSSYDANIGVFVSKPSPVDVGDTYAPKPVHENLFIDALKQSKYRFNSLGEKRAFIEFVGKGVVWNDDPHSFLPEHPEDFALHGKIGCNFKNVTNHFDLYYRSHCGNLQFLHAMASHKNEPAIVTKNAILAWIEYCYKIAIDNNNDIFELMKLKLEEIDGKLSDNGADMIRERVKATEQRIGWSASGIFNFKCDRIFKISWRILLLEFTDLDCPDKGHEYGPREVRNIALGSMLHTIQDSYSKGHVFRSKEGIRQFGLYSSQKAKCHLKADAGPEENVSEELTRNTVWIIDHILYHRSHGTSDWPLFQKEIEKIFAIAPDHKDKLPGTLDIVLKEASWSCKQPYGN